MSAPLAQTFAGNLRKWRVVDMAGQEGRTRKTRFAVIGNPDSAFGEDIELCAVQYLPHAEAIAALPELAYAALGAQTALKLRKRRSKLDLAALSNLDAAIRKAEGRE